MLVPYKVLNYGEDLQAKGCRNGLPQKIPTTRDDYSYKRFQKTLESNCIGKRPSKKES